MGALFQCILFIFFKDPFFRKINLSIMLFNLLPIVPLDGSKILFEIFNNEGKNHYAFGPVDKRECVLIYNKGTRLTMDQIEYII